MNSSELTRPHLFPLLLAFAVATAIALVGCSGDTPAVDPTPTSITDLSAVALNDSTVQLNWSAPSSGGRAVATYDIRYAETAEALDSLDAHNVWPFFASPAPPGAPDSVTISFLKRVTRYYFRVAGVASSGETPPGSVVSLMTVPDTIPPNPVTDLRFSTREDTSLTILWTAPGDDADRGRAYGYVVLVASGVHAVLDPETSRKIRPTARPFPAGVTEVHRLGGLQQKSTYSIGVLARDEAGQESGPSNVLVVTTDRSPQDWYVYANGSGDAPTIQAAIDSTRPGEAIWIGPGTYRENVRIIGQSETLIGIDGAEATIIDGSTRPASVIEIRSAMEDTTRIIGLTITGGSGTPQSEDEPAGGGILAQDAHLLIEECRITSNGYSAQFGRRAAFGGGLFARRRESALIPRIQVIRCDVSNNVALRNGGGIAVAYGASPFIDACNVLGNATQRGDGAGIWILTFGGDAHISGCRISRNYAADHGGGVYIGRGSMSSNVYIYNNVIESNTAEQSDPPRTVEVGAGLWVSDVLGEISQNTIVDNRGPSDPQPRGGGVALRARTGLSFSRNIIALSENNGGVFCFDGNYPTIVSNLFWNNGDGDLFDCNSTIGSGENFVADPLFCDPAEGVWSVASNSPARNGPFGRLGAQLDPDCHLDAPANESSSHSWEWR